MSTEGKPMEVEPEKMASPKKESDKNSSKEDQSNSQMKWESPIRTIQQNSWESSRIKHNTMLNINMTPVCGGLSPNMGNIASGSLNLSSPNTNNKIPINISPYNRDYFTGFQKDDFQLKNFSDKKNPKLVEFSYPAELLSKSTSSKKANLTKLIRTPEMDHESGLKRRLFEKESSEDYGVYGNSHYDVSEYSDEPSIVHNLITPPPKQARRLPAILTDQKLSGVKHLPDGSVYKTHKYKHASYPLLIPFCKKCNLPPILQLGSFGYDAKIGPPPIYLMPMSQQPPPPMPVAKPPSEPSFSNPPSISKPKASQVAWTKPTARVRNRPQAKKASVDENGKRIIRRRKRKSYEQLQMLIKEFQANPDWSKEHMVEVSRKTGLSEAQVYKWGWDQRRKMLDPNHDIQDELKAYENEKDNDDEYEEEEEDEPPTSYKFKLPVSGNK